MRAIQIRVSGPWAHFRKPETNNNPLTHDFLTKTALIGLMGAVLGQERRVWSPFVPQLSSDLRYGIQVEKPVRKESWGFTLRAAFSPWNPKDEKSPRPFEFLRDPQFRVVIALHDERSAEIFDAFARFVREEMACYTPTLGLQPCVAHLAWIGEMAAEAKNGEFSTSGFVRRDQMGTQNLTQPNFRLGFEKIPTAQTSEWWNKLEDYREVVYPSFGGVAVGNGEYFQINGENWCLL
jgi:CRISPR-associated protein Cas5 subtype I-B